MERLKTQKRNSDCYLAPAERKIILEALEEERKGKTVSLAKMRKILRL